MKQAETISIICSKKQLRIEWNNTSWSYSTQPPVSVPGHLFFSTIHIDIVMRKPVKLAMVL